MTRISRTREEILSKVTVHEATDGREYVWVTCHHCGGTGTYPSSMIPPGRCRFYCWRGRTSDTYGKLPIPVDKYVKRQQAVDRREHRAKIEAEKRAKEMERTREERETRKVNLDPRLAKALALSGYTVDDATQSHGDFILSLTGQWIAVGGLSDGQWSALARWTEKREEERSLKDAEILPPTGRVRIEGEVLSTKYQETQYGSTLKMLVLVTTENGHFRLWGTVPQAIIQDVEKGVRVRFTATVEPKEKGFGFFNRPTQAEVVETGEGQIEGEEQEAA